MQRDMQVCGSQFTGICAIISLAHDVLDMTVAH